jgi:hypothetical protein
VRWRSGSKIANESPGYEKLRKRRNTYWDRHPGSLPLEPDLDVFEKYADLYFSNSEEDWILPGENSPFWKTHRASLDRAISIAEKNMESRFGISEATAMREDLVPKSAGDLDFSRAFSFVGFLWYVDERLERKKLRLQRLARKPTAKTMSLRREKSVAVPEESGEKEEEKEETVFSSATEEEEEEGEGFVPYSSLPEEEGEPTIVLSKSEKSESPAYARPRRLLERPPARPRKKTSNLAVAEAMETTKRFVVNGGRSSCSVFRDAYLYSLSYETEMRSDGKKRGDGEFSLFRLSSDESRVTEVWAIKVPKTAICTRLSVLDIETKETAFVPHFEFGETVTVTDASSPSFPGGGGGDVYYEGRDGIKAIAREWRDLLNEDPHFENSLPLIKAYFPESGMSGGMTVRGRQELDKTIVFKRDLSKDAAEGRSFGLVFRIPFVPKETAIRTTLDTKAWYSRHLHRLGSDDLLEQIAFNPNVAMSRKTLAMNLGTLNLRHERYFLHPALAMEASKAQMEPMAGDPHGRIEGAPGFASAARVRAFSKETAGFSRETGGGEEEEGESSSFREESSESVFATRRLTENRDFFVSNDAQSFRNFERRPINRTTVDYVVFSDESLFPNDRGTAVSPKYVSKTVETALSLVVKDSDESTPLISTEECALVVETKDGVEVKFAYEGGGLKENDHVVVDLNAREDFVSASDFEKTVKTISGGISSEVTSCTLRLKRRKNDRSRVAKTETTTTTTLTEEKKKIGSEASVYLNAAKDLPVFEPVECMAYEREEENVIFDVYFFNNAWTLRYTGFEITTRGGVIWYDKAASPEVRTRLADVPMETVDDMYDLLVKSESDEKPVDDGCSSNDAGRTRYHGYVYDYDKKTRTLVSLKQMGDCSSHNDSVYAKTLVKMLEVIYENCLRVVNADRNVDKKEISEEIVDQNVVAEEIRAEEPASFLRVGFKFDDRGRNFEPTETEGGLFVIYDGSKDVFATRSIRPEKTKKGGSDKDDDDEEGAIEKKWKTVGDLIESYSLSDEGEGSTKAAFFIHLVRTKRLVRGEAAKVYFLKWRNPKTRGNFEIVEKSVYFTKKS